MVRQKRGRGWSALHNLCFPIWTLSFRDKRKPQVEVRSMLSSKGWISTAIVLIIPALLLGACSKDPQKAKAKYLAAAQKYMKQKHYGDAAVEFRNAIRLDPRSADTY